MIAAEVRNWPDLLADTRIRLTGGTERLLKLAASWSRGTPVDLSANASGLGTAHAKRVIESIIIGSGMDGFYTLHDGPELAKMREFHASLGIAEVGP